MRILLLALLSFLLISCATTSTEHKGLKGYYMYDVQMLSMTKIAELQCELGGVLNWTNKILIRAKNPATNEIFTGYLVLMVKDKTSTTSTVTNA